MSWSIPLPEATLALAQGSLEHLQTWPPQEPPKAGELRVSFSEIRWSSAFEFRQANVPGSQCRRHWVEPVGGGRMPGVRAHLKPASQRRAVRLRCDRKRQFPAPLTRPDVRTDDEDRQLAAARQPAQAPAVAPTDSPACPFPATGAFSSRDNTAHTTSCVCATTPR
jgi:hypothetical protein